MKDFLDDMYEPDTANDPDVPMRPGLLLIRYVDEEGTEISTLTSEWFDRMYGGLQAKIEPIVFVSENGTEEWF